MRHLFRFALLALGWSCAPPTSLDDAGGVDDAGFTVDAGSTFDAGSSSVDAGAVPLPGFGAITGACGPLAHADLLSATPSTFETTIDFAAMAFDAGALTDGGRRMFAAGNLGGSSLESEVFAFEVLHRCEFAELVATESEVTYTQSSTKRTDLVVDIEGERIGVSVARAFKFPPGTPLSVADAKTVIEGKFSDILISSMNVKAPYIWKKQILHVIAYDETARASVIAAAAQISPTIRADTILYVTLTDGNDAFIY